MKKVLITGVTGFAGQYLAEYLSDSSGDEINGTYHSKESLSRKGGLESKIIVHQVDLTDKSQVERLVSKVRPDEIYHLAAQASPSQSLKDPVDTLMTNIVSELYLLEAVKSVNPNARILIVSSAEVYGAIELSDLPIDEATPLRPTTPYAVSKITQDYLALQYFLAYKSQVIRVRPFNHFGPRQQPRFVVPMFAKQIAEIEKGKMELPMKVGNLKARKDFTDIRDVVRAYSLLMEKGVPGEAYNLGSGRSVEIKDILNILIRLSSKEIIVKIDGSLYRDIEAPDIYCDYSKLRDLTSWEPVIDLETTLKDTLDYYRQVV